MNRVTNFDVLIIYSGRLADSASLQSGKISTPFSKASGKESYNAVYSYFLENCRKNDITAAFSTSFDIVGAGRVKSYWLFENNSWKKVQRFGHSKIIFDKFSPTSEEKIAKRNLLFSSKSIKPFNNPSLFNLCFDKQKTYDMLSNFAIPTVTIESGSKKGIGMAVKILSRGVSKHKSKDDFSGGIVMKDRFGSGGINVYKFKANQEREMLASVKKHKTISFIIQPFIKFDKGYVYKNSSVATDIRLVYLGNKIIQTYIRMAKKGSFRCNEHSGGLLKYIPLKEVPEKVILASKSIVKSFDNKTSLFALDFIISNRGNVHLLEANSGPGLDWNLSMKENEIEAKKLIRIVVKEIVKRIGLFRGTSKRRITANTYKISDYPIVPNILLTA